MYVLKPICGNVERKMAKNVLIGLVMVCLGMVTGVGAEFRDVTKEYRLQFPQDLYLKKDYRVQWWYFTGHLFDGAGREFGYELTFFIVGVQRRAFTSAFGVNDIYISHFAVSDVQEKKYHFEDRSDPGAFGFAGAEEQTLRVWVGKNILKGTMEEMEIRASGKEGSLDLVLRPEKPFVLHGERGYSRKSEESPLDASLYFSSTRIKTEGTLKIGMQSFAVTGYSWFDREISTRGLPQNKAGWDWFSLQLDDGREVMLYLIRNRDGSLDRSSSGTVVLRDGTSLHLNAGDFEVSVQGRYRSDKTGARYPSFWEISVPSQGLDLRVTPLIVDQEFIGTGTTGNSYWEGTCRIEGTAAGRAYVEMTGY
jgi:predicted secreted hydrolase